jgi:hypothetical protein
LLSWTICTTCSRSSSASCGNASASFSISTLRLAFWRFFSGLLEPGPLASPTDPDSFRRSRSSPLGLRKV